MSEFKGTNGPWGFDVDENNHCIDLILPNDTVISHSRSHLHSGVMVIGRDTMFSNMLLISKAPEMLEMLESVVVMFAKGKILHVDKVVEKRTEIEQLIKSATEL